MNQSRFSNTFAKLKHFKTSMSLQSCFHTGALKATHKNVKEIKDVIIL